MSEVKGKVVEFKRKEKDEYDLLERLSNVSNIFHQRLQSFDGSEKELAQLKNELLMMESLLAQFKKAA